MAIDIDTDDPIVLAVLERILPKSPWTRVGKKGNIQVYRYNGERTTRIQGADGSMICEILSKGTQIVLPPSIHPETLKPYTANGDLFTVNTAVPLLPEGIEKDLREALREAGVEVSVGSVAKVASFIPAGARDNAMVAHAGILARAILRGERSLVQALDEMRHWVENFVEKVAGDPISAEKGQQKIIEFLVKDLPTSRHGLPTGWDEDLTNEDKEQMGLAFTVDDEAWSFDRIMKELIEAFATHPEYYGSERSTAVQAALTRVARSPEVSTVQAEMVISYISGQSAGAFSKPALRKELRTLRLGGIEGKNHEEIAQEALDRLQRYGEIRHVAGSFWQWKGAAWARMEIAQMLTFIAKEFGDLPAATKNGDHIGILAVMKNLSSSAQLGSRPAGAVNFANGVVNSKLELVPHDPSFGMTYTLPYRYLPERAGEKPRLNKMLEHAWGSDADYKQKLDGLQEAFGATFMQKATSLQRAFLLHGASDSGKSQILDIIEYMLPPAAFSSLSPVDWGDKFRLSMMFGKMANLAGELPETQSLRGDIFKGVVTGDTMTGEQKNKDPFTLRLTCAQWFGSNHLPQSRDNSVGFLRRWLVFEFTKPVPAKERIRDLGKLIASEEAEAIAAWAIEGYRRLCTQTGYTLSASHERAIEKMACANDSVRNFLVNDSNYLVGSSKTDNIMTVNDIYSAYQWFTTTHGRQSRIPFQAFLGRMGELAIPYGLKEISRDDGRTAYIGIGLKKKLAA